MAAVARLGNSDVRYLCLKKRVLANIRQGFIDKKSIDNGTLKTFPIEDLFDLSM